MEFGRHRPDFGQLLLQPGVEAGAGAGLRGGCAANRNDASESLLEEFLRRVGHAAAALLTQVALQRPLAERQHKHTARQVKVAGHELNQLQQHPGSSHIDALHQHHQRRLRHQPVEQLPHRGVELAHRLHAGGAVRHDGELVQPLHQPVGNFGDRAVAIREVLQLEQQLLRQRDAEVRLRQVSPRVEQKHRQPALLQSRFELNQQPFALGRRTLVERN